MIGTTVAIYNIGLMAGCIVIAIVGDKLSHRGSIFASCLVVIIEAAPQAAVFGVPQLIVGRIATVLTSSLLLTLGIRCWIYLIDSSNIRL